MLSLSSHYWTKHTRRMALYVPQPSPHQPLYEICSSTGKEFSCQGRVLERTPLLAQDIQVDKPQFDRLSCRKLGARHRNLERKLLWSCRRMDCNLQCCCYCSFLCRSWWIAAPYTRDLHCHSGERASQLFGFCWWYQQDHLLGFL